MIEARNLTKNYGNHVAVKDLSFSAQKGTVLGFLGPNGAGKSTTMNMLTGYISATEGSVLINGVNLYDEPETAKKCIGYLPEIPPVYPDMTVTEYLKFVAALKGVAAKNRTKMLAEIMDKVKITDVSNRLIKHLSKGYRQRVGIAGALAGYPEVLIFDEPTVGLDPKQIIEIRDLIKSLAKDHVIILSSHILTEVSAVCDEIMIINKGRLIAVGTPDELVGRVGKSSEIYLDISADKDAAMEVLNGIDDIADIKELESTEEGVVSFCVKEKSGKDLRKQLFNAFAAADMPLLRLNRPEKTLEEIFLEMTEIRKPAQKKAAKPVMRLADEKKEEKKEEEVARTE